MVETPPMPDGKFDLIYADPPWRYESGTTTENRQIENHYPTMPLEDIKGLEIPAKENSVLYLWTTAPMLKKGIKVLESWGFEYKTGAVWDKVKTGMGYWFRVDHEHLLVGVRGYYSPPNPKDRRSSVFTVPRGEHSSKPDKVRAHIEKAHPDAKKLELFSRDGRVGWTMWGNEVAETKQDTLV